MRRNIYSCPPEAKALAYTSLVRPHLEYASAAWDPFTARDITQLDKVQSRSARFAKNNYKWSQSVSQLTSELGWQPLDQCRRNARLTLFYRSIQIQFQFIIYTNPQDIPDNVKPIHLPRFPLALTSINTGTSPELLSTGMLFLTQPVQHHLLIPSVQHSTDYPPLYRVSRNTIPAPNIVISYTE